MDNATEQRELTFGERAVGLTFNPSNDPRVQEIKETYAKIIDCMNAEQATALNNGENGKARLYAIAITEAQTAQMWAVKALTWKE